MNFIEDNSNKLLEIELFLQEHYKSYHMENILSYCKDTPYYSVVKEFLDLVPFHSIKDILGGGIYLDVISDMLFQEFYQNIKNKLTQDQNIILSWSRGSNKELPLPEYTQELWDEYLNKLEEVSDKIEAQLPMYTYRSILCMCYTSVHQAKSVLEQQVLSCLDIDRLYLHEITFGAKEKLPLYINNIFSELAGWRLSKGI
jgi:hypothetical protein